MKTMLISLGLAAALAVPAAAQMNGGPRRGGPMPRAAMDLNLMQAAQGRWWQRANVAQQLGLDAAQQKRLNDIYTSESEHLIDLRATVQKDQLALRSALQASTLNPGQADSDFNQLVDARANVAKAQGKMIEDEAAQLTPEQLTKLHTTLAGAISRRGRPGGFGRGPAGRWGG